MNYKLNNKTYIILIIIIILFYHSGIIDKINFKIYNIYMKYYNQDIYKIIYNMKYTNININNIPNVLKDKISIFNIETDFNKNKKINKNILIKKIFNSIDSKRYVTKNIKIIDYLDNKSKYYFSPHTDIEWNLIKNDGYQVWILLNNNNKNNYGNMFIVYNEYLYNKYKNIYYNLFVKNGKINVSLNCKYNVFQNDYIEDFEIDWFIKNTQLFYLDFNEGDCLVFNKNICHMSDIRGNNSRHAINFRVVIDDVNYDHNSCGYVKDKSIVYEQFNTKS